MALRQSSIGGSLQAASISFKREEFNWHEWDKQSKTSDNFGYWVKEFEVDYFNRRERNEQSQTTWDTDYNHIFKRIDPKENLTEETLIQLVV